MYILNMDYTFQQKLSWLSHKQSELVIVYLLLNEITGIYIVLCSCSRKSILIFSNYAFNWLPMFYTNKSWGFQRWSFDNWQYIVI